MALVFSRVSSLHIAELMQDPELVIELIADMGFSIEEKIDSDSILGLLESRWQGNEQNYSLESFSEIAQHVLFDACPSSALNLLFKGGKQSPIRSANKPIFVLSPAEVTAISIALSSIDILSLQQSWLDLEKFKPIQPDIKAEEIDLFWMLFPGIVNFFTHASNQGECVLRSLAEISA